MSVKLNPNFGRLNENYLFSEITKRVRVYEESHPGESHSGESCSGKSHSGERDSEESYPEAKIIRLGIGDVTLPLAPTVIAAMHRATDEMADKSTFRGYAPESGYDFLRQAVAGHYLSFGVKLSPEEVFISDGAKSDVGNMTDIFGDNEVLIPDPVYPVYVDSNVMSGRSIYFLNATAENYFLPLPDGLERKSRVIYLCSPNNPTGAVYSREQLTRWVEFANETESVIIFDSAYEAYINGEYPHSIYEIPGAKTCAVEVCSLSKSAGFTGNRCAWTVIPEKLEAEGKPISRLWVRRQAARFNGVPYVIQRAAEAALSPAGQAECREMVSYYRENARILTDALRRMRVWFTGGEHSPYIWLKCPGGRDSWSFFDELLNKLRIVGTPGAGFGNRGEGYFRLSAYGDREDAKEAARRISESQGIVF